MIRLDTLKIRWWMAPAAFAVIFLVVAFVFFWLPNTFDDPAARIVTIPRGVSFKAAVDSLASSGVIRSRWSFKVAGRLSGGTRIIKVGKYLFKSGLSNLDILRDMESGKSRMMISVTVPEGWRMVPIARRFEHDLGIDAEKFLFLCRDTSFISKQGIESPTLEGYLLPDTYNFYWQTDEPEIVQRMVGAFKQFYVDSLRERQDKLRLTRRQVVTFASIVEGESGIVEERPVIAGVYWNRLKRRMKLEADPTLQYVIPDGPRRLLNRDLKYNSPYNTYVYYGLPPGPINNPSRESILAVLYPEKHQYLYFVATGIGGHRFSKSFSEHQRAVKSYRRIKREIQRNAALGLRKMESSRH